MSVEARAIAIDLGATSGRIAAGVVRKGVLEVDVLNRFETGPVPIGESLYWDVLGFWQHAIRVLRAIPAAWKIQSIGVDSWAADFGLLSPTGELLGQVHHYRDVRTAGMMESASRLMSKEDLYKRTGLQFATFNTLFQLLAVKREAPELLDAAETLLFIPDLINFWLCGARSTERTIASTSQLLDPLSSQWLKDIMETTGIPQSLFPNVVAPGTALRKLRRELQNETTAETVVVAPAEHDTASAVAAVPAVSGTTWCFISSGTWSLVGAELPAPHITAIGLEHNVTNEAGVDGTTRLIKGVMGLWLLEESRRNWEELALQTLLDESKSAPPFKCLINPNDPLFFAPGKDMVERIARYCDLTGQPSPGTPSEVARCILESLAVAHARAIEVLRELTGLDFDVVHVVGGGARNALLCQWTANAAGMPVVAGPSEATLIGNLLLQFEAVGRIPSLQRRAVVRNSVDLHRYEPRQRALWTQQLRAFRRLPTDILRRPEPRNPSV